MRYVTNEFKWTPSIETAIQCLRWMNAAQADRLEVAPLIFRDLKTSPLVAVGQDETLWLQGRPVKRAEDLPRGCIRLVGKVFSGEYPL